MRPKLYVENSILSYLTAFPSRDLVTAGRQQLTREWWQTRRTAFDLYVSEFVVDEASAGDPEMAALRIAALKGIPEIRLTDKAARLARELVEKGPLPTKAALDAAHIAVAVSGGVDYLLTWNFKHLANARMRSRIDAACRAFGYQPCVICTPEELSEE